MDFTSTNRLLRYLPGQREAALTNDGVGRRDLLIWIPAVSAMVEGYLNRTVQTAAQTEYFDIGYGQVEYWVKAAPITTLTSVYVDPTGEYDGGESEVTDCIIATDSRSVILPSTFDGTYRKGLRIIYTGGLAAHGTRSTFAISTSAGTWHADKYMVGSTSGAVGIVVTASATAPVVEVLYGVFVAGETLTEYDTETSQGSSDAVATLTSKTATALCEAYPEVTLATEMQIRFMAKHKNDFENSSSQRDGTSTRDNVGTAYVAQSTLRPEVQAMLSNLRRITV